MRRTLLADTDTPVSLFLALAAGSDHAALFESVEGGEKWARKSLIAIGARETFVAERVEDAARLFEALPPPDRASSPLDGVFGWFAYEAAQAFLPVRGLPCGAGPVCEFFRPNAVLLYDHQRHTLDLHTIESGCCGMAGAFGYEARHYEVSMKMAELNLLPAVRAHPQALIVADGTSCRRQIADGSGREAQHVATVLDSVIRDVRDRSPNVE